MTGAVLTTTRDTSPLLTLPPGLDSRRVLTFRTMQSETPLIEDPLYSNRSPALDRLCDRWGIPRGSYWCAVLAADVRSRCNAPFPPIDPVRGWHPAIAETWRVWAIETGLFFTDWSKLQIADLVLYGVGGHAPAHHVGGCVAAIARAAAKTYAWDFEGNTTGDPNFSSNGELLTVKPVDAARVLGFVGMDRAA